MNLFLLSDGSTFSIHHMPLLYVCLFPPSVFQNSLQLHRMLLLSWGWWRAWLSSSCLHLFSRVQLSQCRSSKEWHTYSWSNCLLLALSGLLLIPRHEAQLCRVPPNTSWRGKQRMWSSFELTHWWYLFLNS